MPTPQPETTVSHKVAVHKALPLEDGETVSAFTSLLRAAVDQYLKQQLSLDTQEKCSCWMVEVMSTVVVSEFWKEGEGYKYFAVKFDRNKDGSFKLSGLVEVERVVSYQEKKVALAKRRAWESTNDEAWVQKANLFAGVL